MEALDLLTECRAGPQDRIIFTGDLVDRGPYPVECIELAMNHESVLGNHEDKHLQYRQSGVTIDMMPRHHSFTHRQMTERHWTFIQGMPLVIPLPEYNSIVLHAGLWPERPLAEQVAYHLLNMQCVSPDNRTSWPSKSPKGTFWTNYWTGPQRIIFGHTGLNKPLHTEFAVGIDTGCVFGRELTAYILPDDRIVQVKAKQKYYGRRSHPTLGETDWSTLIPVHGDVCTYS